MIPFRSAATLRSLLDATVATMLATSTLTVGCGGKVPGEVERDDTTSTADASPPQAPVTQACGGYPAPTFDVGACGEGGQRMTDAFCEIATRQMPCDLELDAGVAGLADCSLVQLDDELCSQLCWTPAMRCGVKGTPACHGASSVACLVQKQPRGLVVVCEDRCPGGRRLDGYGGEPSFARDPLGRFFARLAQLETVSIVAFGVLANELTHHDAPVALVMRARRAQRDEVRHARATWALARRFGARPTRLRRPARMAPRSLLAMALENAREGCVRETYGALVTMHQARAARDVEVASVMETIAHDESEHAALAADLHRFFEARLDARARAAVASAMREAFVELREQTGAPMDAASARAAGLPTRDVSLAAIATLEQAFCAA